MLRTNLATRPFYNERAVHMLLAIAGLLVAGVSCFNVASWTTLSRQQAVLAGQVKGSETRARELQQDAQRLRRSINRSELEAVSQAAREANRLIGRRTFSWTGLLSRFEETLPADVRIVAVSPRLDKDGRMQVTMVVVGRRAEDIDGFVERLEGTGAFSGVLSRQEVLNEDGLLEVTLEGLYVDRAIRAVSGGL